MAREEAGSRCGAPSGRGSLGALESGEQDGGIMGRVAGDDGELGCAQLGGRDGGEPVAPCCCCTDREALAGARQL